MVVADVVQDANCNSCSVHFNLSKVSNILPLVSVDDALDFLIQLCEKLNDLDKRNVWTILQSAESKYSRQEAAKGRDSFASHKLQIVMHWFRSDDITDPQRLTFVLKALSYVDQKVLLLLRDFLTPYSDIVNEEDFKPDITHCPWSGQWPCFTERSGCVDFISRLPVTVSKLVLCYVGVNHIWGARLVSKRWYMIIKEVLREHKQFQAHVFRCRALRPAMRNVNPTFANKVALCFSPGVCTTGHPYVSEEERGAIKVILEERNVYCGAYHVHNLYKYQDTHRKLHYCRGKYFVIGSNDRRIHVRDMESGKVHKTIVGHAGSIQSLVLIEKLKIVISGSYDLTIRAWSIETGAYLRMWRGHRGTITCIDHNDTLLVSGARDSMVKVWYLRKAMIKRTLHHPRPIISVRLLGDRAAVGTESFHLYLWDITYGQKLKVFSTMGKVHCVNLTPHYVMGGAHNVMYVWNMISLDDSPMFTLPHPGRVVTTQYYYVRCVTGCEDGKVRVWSLVSGDCIKVIRANARGDPITALFVDVDRLVVNTASGVISLNFIPTTWDYCSQRFNEDKQHTKQEEGGSGGGGSGVKRTALKRRCKSAAAQLRSPAAPPRVSSTPALSAPVNSAWSVRRPIELTSNLMTEIIRPNTPDVPPSSPDREEAEIDITPEEQVVDLETDDDHLKPEQIRTTVVETAVKQLLFEDVFNRGPISYCGLISKPNIETVNTAGQRSTATRPGTTSPVRHLTNHTRPNNDQLKKMKSKRPSSAPFVSASLSVHGHLPSFAKRRPNTASLIRHRVEVEPTERWQSTWQRLLSDIPEDHSHTDTKPPPSCSPERRASQQNNSHVTCTERLARSCVRRPKTATARIRY